MKLTQRILRRLARLCDRLAADRGPTLSPAARAGEVEAICRDLAGCGPENASPDEIAGYLAESAPRFVITSELLPDEPGPLLELGASPYLFTLLLRARGYDPQLANFFSPGRGDGSETVRGPGGEMLTLTFRHFNVEIERFPYPDTAFATVLCAEIIEHLLLDPVFMLQEIRRVLRPNGVCVLTTPNAARRANIVKLQSGGNCHDQYSGHGAYGRHNREYTLDELRALCEDNGFVVERLFAADLQPQPDADANPATHEHLFLRARRTDRPAPAVRPPWLYRSI